LRETPHDSANIGGKWQEDKEWLSIKVSGMSVSEASDVAVPGDLGDGVGVGFNLTAGGEREDKLSTRGSSPSRFDNYISGVFRLLM
jgi:hypothetical protein